MIKKTTLILTILFLIFPAFALAQQWHTLDSKNFIFYYPPGENSTARSLAEVAELLRERTVKTIGYDFKEKTKVYLAPNRKAYQSVQPRAKVPEWSVGVAFSRKNLIVIYTPSGAAAQGFNYNLKKVFHHELCHIVLGRAIGREKIPKWLNEGVAKYLAGEWSNTDSFKLTIAYAMGAIIPLEELMYAWPKESGKARLAYIQSKSLVAYLARKGQLKKLIHHLAKGKNIDEAIVLATGLSLDDLEERWRKYISRAHTWVFMLFRHEFVWTAMALLFLLAYWRVRVRTKKKLKKLELEDELEDHYTDGGPTFH